VWCSCKHLSAQVWAMSQCWQCDLRRLIAGIVDCVAKGFVSIENAWLKELLESSDECFGTASQVYQMMNIMVGVQ
jgi:hypothetical protein